jgi:UDP:flavonoid glycosyltransferase YjiC (YdhE family)
VYVTFGTVLGHMTIAADVYRAALQAARDVDARVLLTVGRAFDPVSLGPVPTNVHVEAWVDQDRVLREADVVVCHGGSGTTFGALRAGIPLVVVPLFADQPDNGVKVAESRSGVVLDLDRDARPQRSPLAPHDTSSVTDAIRAVLADASYRDHAQLIGEEMAAAPSPDDVLAAILDH